MSALLEFYKRAGNQVLQVNWVPDTIDIHITNHGSDWLWAVFAIFGCLTIIHTLIYFFTSASNRSLKKSLFIAPFIISIVMSVVYFTYASNLGYAGVPVEFHHVTTSHELGVRQMFYVKYIGYFLSWPLVLYSMEIATHTLDLSESASTGKTLQGVISIATGLFAKFIATEVFVLGLLVGLLIESTYKWGYFTFAAFGALVAITLVVISCVGALNSYRTNKFAVFLILFEVLVWILYLIAWGLSEGGNVIQPDSEAVFYGVLDLITFGILPTALTFMNASGLDESRVFDFHLRPIDEKLPETPRASGDTTVPSEPTTQV